MKFPAVPDPGPRFCMICITVSLYAARQQQSEILCGMLDRCVKTFKPRHIWNTNDAHK